jgi:hypothetical protein
LFCATCNSIFLDLIFQASDLNYMSEYPSPANEKSHFRLFTS